MIFNNFFTNRQPYSGTFIFSLAVASLKKAEYPLAGKNGKEAVEAANQKDYDFILMDVQMPVMDGLEATLAIRKTVVRQPTIIALTANAMAGDEEQCLQAGMDDYLGKPVKPKDLVWKLKKWYAHA